MVPPSRMMLPFVPGRKSSAARGDPALLLGEPTGALAEAELDEGHSGDRHGAAVHAAQHARALQDGQVAPDGLGGDAELLGGCGHAQPPALVDQYGEGVLTFLGIHRPPLLNPGRRRPTVLSIAIYLWVRV